MHLVALTAWMACSGGSQPAEQPLQAEPKPAATAPKPAEPAPAQPAEAKAPAEGTGQQASAFDPAAVFSSTCASCHGAEGKGDGPAGQALDPKPRNFTDAAWWEKTSHDRIVAVIKNGGAANGLSPLMAPYGGTFKDEQIDQLASWIEETFRPKQ